MDKIKETFRENTKFRLFLLSVLITGLSYGLYKGMLDNFLAEVVGMGEMDRGITEFFRELPGIALIFILAAFYTLSAETLYKAGALIMLAGMGMHALLPPTKVLAILAICMYSLGEHIQLGMKNTISLEYAKPGCGGEALGIQNSANQVGTLVGYLVIVAAFSALAEKQPYTLFFWLAAVLAAVSLGFSAGLSGNSKTDETKRRFYFHKKYTKYYWSSSAFSMASPTIFSPETWPLPYAVSTMFWTQSSPLLRWPPTYMCRTSPTTPTRSRPRSQRGFP